MPGSSGASWPGVHSTTGTRQTFSNKVEGEDRLPEVVLWPYRSHSTHNPLSRPQQQQQRQTGHFKGSDALTAVTTGTQSLHRSTPKATIHSDTQSMSEPAGRLVLDMARKADTEHAQYLKEIPSLKAKMSYPRDNSSSTFKQKGCGRPSGTSIS